MALDIGHLEETVCIRGQTVVHGDCFTGLAQMPPGSVDVVVTSPPYNLGIAYSAYHDKRPRKEYLDWIVNIMGQVARVLSDDGALFLNMGSTNTDPWIGMDVAESLKEIFVLQNHILWVKSISIGDDTVGHFKPISSYRYLNQNHEAIFHFTKTGSINIDRLSIGVPYKDKSNIARRGHAQDRRCGGNVWFVPYETVKSRSQKFNHPAGFPVDLVKRCLKLHGAEGLVLDPFLGAGTTLVAAETLGLPGIGFEIDPAYAKVAADRLRDLTPELGAKVPRKNGLQRVLPATS